MEDVALAVGASYGHNVGLPVGRTSDKKTAVEVSIDEKQGL